MKRRLQQVDQEQGSQRKTRKVYTTTSQEEKRTVSGESSSGDGHLYHPNDDTSAFPARSSKPIIFKTVYI
jgi:hypothetical protein